MPADGLLFGPLTRMPPSNLMAERALLGAILANNKAFERVASFLSPDHFADPINGRIFQAIAHRIAGGKLADAVTLKAAFEHAGVLEEVGGTAYLSELIASMVGIINAGDYGRAVQDTWLRRQLIEIAERLSNDAYGSDPDADMRDIARSAVAEIDRLLMGDRLDSTAMSLDQAMDAALESIDRARNGHVGSISTGFRCFDARLGGLNPGFVYVLAGRPGMGKSALGHKIALNAARAGVGVLEISLEMSAMQLGRRALATMANVSIGRMQRGEVSEHEAARLVKARKEFSGLPLTIDDAGGQSAAQIAAKARAAKRKHGLGLLMVDHLNLMRAEDADARHGGTWAVGRASNMMLQVAKDCGVPVLLLAQLSRGPEGREDKRPVLSDLRQAGDIEQDAYAVGFVYRPEYYLGGEPERLPRETDATYEARRDDWNRRRDEVRGRAEVIWPKVRDGEPGTDALRFYGPTTTFSEDAP